MAKNCGHQNFNVFMDLLWLPSFDHRWPKFKLNQVFIKFYILYKLYEDWVEYVVTI